MAGREGEMRERLAALAHQQWSSWMKYLFSESTSNADGSITIPAWAATRWRRQAYACYSELTETERDSDRHEADRIIAVLEEAE